VSHLFRILSLPLERVSDNFFGSVTKCIVHIGIFHDKELIGLSVVCELVEVDFFLLTESQFVVHRTVDRALTQELFIYV
jgi:hypothetical protein